jgi:hypothetical protein
MIYFKKGAFIFPITFLIGFPVFLVLSTAGLVSTLFYSASHPQPVLKQTCPTHAWMKRYGIPANLPANCSLPKLSYTTTGNQCPSDAFLRWHGRTGVFSTCPKTGN